MEFREWITEKYVQWRGNAIGNERTVKDFAEYVGVSQPLMSLWMKPKGKIPKDPEKIARLVARFGFEVYDVLGYLRPAEGTGIEVWYSPERFSKEEAHNIFSEANKHVASLNLSDADERQKAHTEFLEQRGFQFIGADMVTPLQRASLPNKTIEQELDRELLDLFDKLSPEDQEDILELAKMKIERRKNSNAQKTIRVDRNNPQTDTR